MKIKKSILMLVIPAVLLVAALLLSVSLAKYIDSMHGYTVFDVEKFNAAILPPENQTPALTEGSSMVRTISAHSLRPGMTASFGDTTVEDTAAHIPFRVANGTKDADATTLPLQYTVKLRTSQCLPLTYTLAHTVTTVENGTPTTHTTYYAANQPPKEILDNNSDVKYEYTFSPNPPGTTPPAPAEEGSETAPPAEAKFEIAAGDRSLRFNTHELIAEWDSEDSGEKYMKEVEVIELLVHVISLEHHETETEDENNGEDEPPSIYSSGLIILTPPAGEKTTETYTYEIDLRSFRAGETKDDPFGFELKLENGMGKTGIQQTYKRIQYTMELQIPDKLLTELEYTFGLVETDTDPQTPLLGEETPYFYRVIDLKSGELAKNGDVPLDNLSEPPEELEDGCVLYRVYTITHTGLIENMGQDALGQSSLVYASRIYRIVSNQTSPLETDSHGYLYKLELTVKATFVDPIASAG